MSEQFSFTKFHRDQIIDLIVLLLLFYIFLHMNQILKILKSAILKASFVEMFHNLLTGLGIGH